MSRVEGQGQAVRGTRGWVPTEGWQGGWQRKLEGQGDRGAPQFEKPEPVPSLGKSPWPTAKGGCAGRAQSARRPPGGGRTVCPELEEASAPPKPTAGGGSAGGTNQDTVAGATLRIDTVPVARGRPHTPGPAPAPHPPTRLHTHRLHAGPRPKAVLPTFQTRQQRALDDSATRPAGATSKPRSAAPRGLV